MPITGRVRRLRSPHQQHRTYFSVFKRGTRGTYQHSVEKHLHRYLAEFDFQYNNRIALGIEDKARALKAIKVAKGKQLTYRQPDGV